MKRNVLNPGVHLHEVDHCPHCHMPCDHATVCTTGETRAPQPGDYSLCPNCGAMNVFGANMKRRKMTEAEFNALPADARHHLLILKEICKWFDEHEPEQRR